MAENRTGPKKVKMAARDMPDAKCKIKHPIGNLNPGDVITLPKARVRSLVERELAEYIEDMPSYTERVSMGRRGEIWETVRSMTVPVTKGGQSARRREVQPSGPAAPETEDDED